MNFSTEPMVTDEALLDDAVAFAQPVLRADPAADLGKVVGRRRQLVGLVSRPSAVSFSQSGMLLCSGQWT